MLFIDLETSFLKKGFRKRDCIILQLGAVINNATLQRTCALPSPLPNSCRVKETTAFSQKLGRPECSEADALQELGAFAEKNNAQTLVAHNGKGHDFHVIDGACDRLGIINCLLRMSRLDTLPMLRKAFPIRKQNKCSFKLSELYLDMFKEPLRDAHTALADAVALKRIYNSLPIPSIQTVPDALITDSVLHIRGIGKKTAAQLAQLNITKQSELLALSANEITLLPRHKAILRWRDQQTERSPSNQGYDPSADKLRVYNRLSKHPPQPLSKNISHGPSICLIA